MLRQKKYIGIDIGGTKTALIVITADGQIIERIQYDTVVGANAWEISYKQIKQIVEQFLSKYEIESIGICCGGPLDSKKGIIISPPNLPGWVEIPIVDIMKNDFNHDVFLENDANAGAVAEWKFGAGVCCNNLVFITFGTGLGAGLILNGKLYSGTNDYGGEVGHIRLSEDGPIGYNKHGSFEGYCSGTGLSQMMAFELLCLKEEIGKEQMLKLYKQPGDVTGKDVVDWAKNGDKLALKVVEKSGLHLGKGLSILIDILNPELIIVGGMGVRLGNLLIEPARKVINVESISGAKDICRIVPAALGENIGDYAALSVAMKSTWNY